MFLLGGVDVYGAVVWGAAMCCALGFGIVFVSGRLVKVRELLLVCVAGGQIYSKRKTEKIFDLSL